MAKLRQTAEIGPPRKKGTIRVRLVYKGRAKPRVIERGAMTRNERAMQDLLDAVGRLGWQVGEHPKGGLVVGDAEFVERVGIEQPPGSSIADPSRLDTLIQADSEIAPERALSESPSEDVQEDAILPRDPEAPESKVAGRILGVRDGKPVGFLGKDDFPDDLLSVVCEPIDPDDPVIDRVRVLPEEG